MTPRHALALKDIRQFSTLGRYEILLPVAKGGMAVVWAARLQGTRGFQKVIAIKTMLPDVSDDPDFESMFLDEARVAARIRHPNVVEILDLGEENDVIYIAMEWIEGTTLSALMKAAKPSGGIPLPIVVRIASQICAGLHGAHELRDDRGVLVDLVHRDVSPVNILISTGGFAKVADFGVAKSTARQHVTRAGGIVKGKMPYLSPEQFEGGAMDRRSDLFSLGVLLYIMITGVHPFRAESDIKTLENISLKDPTPLRELVPSLDPEVERIVLKALEKDREKRFSTAAEMQRALELIAPSLGPVTTNEDVAEFVHKILGDVLERNAAELRQAIAIADGGPTEAAAPPPASLPVAIAPASGDAKDASPVSLVPASEAPASEVPVSIDGDLAEEVRFDDDAPDKASKEEAAPAEKKAAAVPAPPKDAEGSPAADKPRDSVPQPPEKPAVAAAAPVKDSRDADRNAGAPGGLIDTIKKSRTAQLVVGGVAAAAVIVLWMSLGGQEPAQPTGAQPSRQGTPSENTVAAPQPLPTAQPEAPAPAPSPEEAPPAASAAEPASSSAPPVIAAVEPVSPPAATTAAPATTKAKSPTTSAARPPASKPAAPTKPPTKSVPTKPGTKKFVPKGI